MLQNKTASHSLVYPGKKKIHILLRWSKITLKFFHKIYI